MAPQIWSSETATKQLNLNRLSDAVGFKDGDASKAKNQILSSFVYNIS